jgi:hypothetical protein
MGHWIHDSMSNTQYPSMWSPDSYYTVGTLFKNPSWGTVVKLTQTLSTTLLNETSINVNGNTINMTPVGIYTQPTGWSAVGIFNTTRGTGFPGCNSSVRRTQPGQPTTGHGATRT